RRRPSCDRGADDDNPGSPSGQQLNVTTSSRFDRDIIQPHRATASMENLERPISISTSEQGVRTIILDRPDRLNAVNDALARALPEALDAASADDEVRVVVITGAGRGFCAGLDLKEP